MEWNQVYDFAHKLYEISSYQMSVGQFLVILGGLYVAKKLFSIILHVALMPFRWLGSILPGKLLLGYAVSIAMCVGGMASVGQGINTMRLSVNGYNFERIYLKALEQAKTPEATKAVMDSVKGYQGQWEKEFEASKAPQQLTGAGVYLTTGISLALLGSVFLIRLLSYNKLL